MTAILEASRFDEVILPIIDYVEPYLGLSDARSARSSYRFTDRDGELLAIRSDFTPMLARALAPQLDSLTLPARLFYRGDVIRYESSRLAGGSERFQIGAEWIGGDAITVDTEMLRLAEELAGCLTSRPRVIYSSAAIASALSPAAREALTTRRPFTEGSESERRIVGGVATLDDLEPATATTLRTIASTLDDRFTLQIDDLEPNSYYTGIVFQVYCEQTRRLIARGGRYDNLYALFGHAAPAAGFTFTIPEEL